MFKVGLTGGIGSGKTVVSDRLAACGAGVVDSDVVARRVTAPGGTAIPAIGETFGPSFITGDGALDRARMRQLVFSDPSARARLEAITHPLIRAETAREVALPLYADVPYLVFAVPLLVESKGTARMDRVLVVDCPEATQIDRVMRRSQLDATEVHAIIRSQASRAERLAYADDVLLNDGKTLAELHEEIDALHRRYVGMADGTVGRVT